MTHNQYLHRTGKRAISAMTIRNTYSNQFGIQYYLIVEGKSDEKFFENILDCSKCKVTNLEGKKNVKEFIEAENQKGHKGYLGIVDADFEHIDGYEKNVNNVLLTDVHDIEMMMFSSDLNMRRLYSELSENIVINMFNEKHQDTFLNSIIKVAYNIGLLKMVMQRPHYNVNMKDLYYSDFISKDFQIDLDTLINRVKNRNDSLYEIKKEMEGLRNKQYDKFQVCCGHDVTNILALSFTSEQDEGLGYGNNKNLGKDRIESLLRVAYNFDHFVSTKLYAGIVEWENNNDIFIIDRTIIKAS